MPVQLPISFLFCLLSLSSCNSSKNSNQNNSSPNNNLHDMWAVRELYGTPIKILETKTPKQITLEIFVNELKILGNDGCNNFFGTIDELNAEKISFRDIGSTKKLCPNRGTPNSFNKAMKEITVYELKNTNLYFRNSAGVVIMQLFKVD
ncbi:META domain-containing protein [Patiriisocius sp. Uisw_017]|uniref:META domain-containing protein n=1 Tax=Patiriisocius sp. Uisw_017 TaxID=3230968 RepID=UPI0039E76213